MIGIKFIKAQPNIYLLQYSKGRVIREGVGLAFFYYAPTTSLVAVPVASAEAPFIFQEVTSDFQTVSIQGQVTYRVADAKKLAALMNFTLDARGQKHVSDDPQKLPQRVINVVNVLARAELQKLCLSGRPSVLQTHWCKRCIRTLWHRQRFHSLDWKSSA